MPNRESLETTYALFETRRTGHSRVTRAFHRADDFDDTTGASVLDFWQAQQKARELGRYDRDGGSQKLVTVGQCLDEYGADLKTRGGDIANVQRDQASF